MNPFTRIEYLCSSKNQSCQADLSRHPSHNLTPLCLSSHTAGSGTEHRPIDTLTRSMPDVSITPGSGGADERSRSTASW